MKMAEFRASMAANKARRERVAKATTAKVDRERLAGVRLFFEKIADALARQGWPASGVATVSRILNVDEITARRWKAGLAAPRRGRQALCFALLFRIAFFSMKGEEWTREADLNAQVARLQRPAFAARCAQVLCSLAEGDGGRTLERGYEDVLDLFGLDALVPNACEL